MLKHFQQKKVLDRLFLRILCISVDISVNIGEHNCWYKLVSGHMTVGSKKGKQGKKIGAGRRRRAGAGRASAESGGQNSFGNICIEDCFIIILSIPSGILRCTSPITTRP